MHLHGFLALKLEIRKGKFVSMSHCENDFMLLMLIDSMKFNLQSICGCNLRHAHRPDLSQINLKT